MTIKEQIRHLEKDFTAELTKMRAEIGRVSRSFNKRLLPVEDYVVGQKALVEAKKKGTISISEEVWNVFKWLVLIIGALLGLKLI